MRVPTTKLPGMKPPTPGSAVRVTVDGTPVAIFNVGGRLYGIGATCTHVGGPLEKGRVEGTTVTCPWHGSQFDVTDGKVVRGPAQRPERAYRIVDEADGLSVEID